jgi:hypothetical protein
MACRPMHVSFEVDPSSTQKIGLKLDKTCDATDRATWKMTFDVEEGTPRVTVFSLSTEIDPEYHPQAEATAQSGLDRDQTAQAQVAAAVAKDPNATLFDKEDAIRKVIIIKIQSSVPSGRPNGK